MGDIKTEVDYIFDKKWSVLFVAKIFLPNR